MLQLTEILYCIVRQYLLGIYLQNEDQDWLYRQKISKEGNIESKKRFLYVNSTIRLDTMFFRMFYFSILKVLLLLLVFCCLKSVLFPNRNWKCQEFLVQNVRIKSEMSGICDHILEWQPCKRTLRRTYVYISRKAITEVYVQRGYQVGCHGCFEWKWKLISVFKWKWNYIANRNNKLPANDNCILQQMIIFASGNGNVCICVW